MNQLVSCAGCGGYAPAARASCPHCGGGRLLRLLGRVVGAGAFLITMSACYGAPPDKCVPSDDKDGDGFCPSSRRASHDCDDSNPAVNAGATDTPGDGVDQDCSGADAPPTATPVTPPATPPATP